MTKTQSTVSDRATKKLRLRFNNLFLFLPFRRLLPNRSLSGSGCFLSKSADAFFRVMLWPVWTELKADIQLAQTLTNSFGKPCSVHLFERTISGLREERYQSPQARWSAFGPLIDSRRTWGACLRLHWRTALTELPVRLLFCRFTQELFQIQLFLRCRVAHFDFFHKE